MVYTITVMANVSCNGSDNKYRWLLSHVISVVTAQIGNKGKTVRK